MKYKLRNKEQLRKKITEIWRNINNDKELHQSDDDPSPPQGGAAAGRRGGLVLQLDVHDNDVQLLQGIVTVPCYFLKDFLGLSFSSNTI